MKIIDNPCSVRMSISIKKIKPFVNVCKVTGQKENCNVEIEYIPDRRLVELASYREYFEKGFNEYIEKLCENVFNELEKLLQPKYLRVRIYMDEATLTPWHVEMIT